MDGFRFLIGCFAVVLLGIGAVGWDDAHATFYGDLSGNATMYGACGYGNLFQQGYGLETTALSTALFDNGTACGACFQIVCADSQWCLKGTNYIRVTATNFCPPSSGPQAWCNPPRKHFDLSQRVFLQIARYEGGIVPVKYRRVSCVKQGGIKFELNGNPYWLLVLVYNVGGVGDVSEVRIKASNTEWIQMSRNWGQNWQAWGQFQGESLSFQVTVSTGKSLTMVNVVASSWQFGQSYEAKENFHGLKTT
ncbi:hypothetical protein Droror1_Dr00009810 [Drosera rotundifolia]